MAIAKNVYIRTYVNVQHNGIYIYGADQAKQIFFGSIVKALTRDPVQELQRVIANVDGNDAPKYHDYASILYCIYGTVPINKHPEINCKGSK